MILKKINDIEISSISLLGDMTAELSNNILQNRWNGNIILMLNENFAKGPKWWFFKKISNIEIFSISPLNDLTEELSNNFPPN